MAKTSGIVKNSTPVGKSSSSRDSQPDDLDTILVVSSDEIRKARDAAESVTSETATIDCHPVILDDSEESTDRFDGKHASSSGLVAKSPMKVVDPVSPSITTVRADGPLPKLAAADEPEPETTTITAPKLPASIDEDEEIEISASGFISEELDGTPTREAIVDAIVSVQAGQRAKTEKAEPRATITEVREVIDSIVTTPVGKGLADAAAKDPRVAGAKDALGGTLDDETATEERPKVEKPPAKFDDETMPLPKADLALLGGALETVPLSAAMVQNVIAQVDARAAARATGQPAPAFHRGAAPAPQPMPPPHATPRQLAPQAPLQPPPSPRRLGVEILITLLAFLAVAVPALYYLYVSFSQ